MAREILTAEERRRRKSEYQRKIRNQLKAQGISPYKSAKVPDEIKEERKILRKQKQQEWLKSEAGLAFAKRQSDRLRKFDSKEERDTARNKRRREELRTDLDKNLKHRLVACKQRAKRDNLPFDLDFDYLKSIYTDTCPYLGIKLSLISTSGNSMDALSIDKIIPEKGYTKGNIQIISYKANVMKQDVDLNTLRLFAKSIFKLHGESDATI